MPSCGFSKSKHRPRQTPFGQRPALAIGRPEVCLRFSRPLVKKPIIEKRMDARRRPRKCQVPDRGDSPPLMRSATRRDDRADEGCQEARLAHAVRVAAFWCLARSLALPSMPPRRRAVFSSCMSIPRLPGSTLPSIRRARRQAPADAPRQRTRHADEPGRPVWLPQLTQPLKKPRSAALTTPLSSR